jgi:hypothetical protein
VRAGVIYRGPSLIDGAPIVAVALFVASAKDANGKTGPMVQSYILVDDERTSPDEAAALGLDVSICGGCVHRYRWDDSLHRFVRTCYVTLFQGPRVVWATLLNGDYPDAMSHEARASIGRGRPVRLGTYGDPAAVPVHVWRSLLSEATGHTGYTHQWRAPKFRALQGMVMASCDTEADRARAHAAGWGTFTVVPRGTDVPVANLCPASAEAGKVATCAECQRCDGRQDDVRIPAHGASARLYSGRRSLNVLANV